MSLVKEYILGRCQGCLVAVSGAVVTDHKDRDMDNAWEMLDSGLLVSIVTTDKPVTVGNCLCSDN